MTDSINDNRNPYINKDGKLKLHKSIVGFIDVLGFKELVRNARKEGKSQEHFTDFHQALSTWFNRIEEIRREMSFPGASKDSDKIRIYTDCILIGHPINKSVREYNFIEGCDEFRRILLALCHLQLEMTNEGYFIRGAIAIDELYMDDIIIYGNGAIDAYEAESKQAKYPRIILTKSAEDMLMEISQGFVEQNRDNFISQYLYRDSDGKLFLSYLESIKIGDDDYQFVNELEKHQQRVEENLIKYHDNPHILEKYVWAANYHNYFCNQPPCYDGYRIDLTEYKIRHV